MITTAHTAQASANHNHFQVGMITVGDGDQIAGVVIACIGLSQLTGSFAPLFYNWSGYYN